VASDTNAWPDVFVHDRTTGITERVSVDSSEVQGGGASEDPYIALSPDGQVVVFQSSASNLAPGDTNTFQDIFLRDRSAGTTERVTFDSSGGDADNNCYAPTMSADGRFVAFASAATDLVAGDTNGRIDVFVRDRTAGTTERASVDASGAEVFGFNHLYASISANGQVVVFTSLSPDLVSGDNNNLDDTFVRARCDALWSNYGAGFPGTNGVPTITCPSDPVLGTTVTVDLSNSYGIDTTGLLFIGTARWQLPSSWGGDLLVLPSITMLVDIPAAGTSITGDLPDDGTLCGFLFDLQAFEVDPGAAEGVSFTRGLELVLGR
jgi:hypothetical protein